MDVREQLLGRTYNTPEQSRMAKPASVVLVLAVSTAALIAWITMPELRLFFLIPAIIGIGAAFLLRRSGRRLDESGQDSAGRSPEINISQIKVGGGVAGLIFTIGSMWIFLAGIPALWYFLALAIAAGAGVAVALRFTNTAR